MKLDSIKKKFIQSMDDIHREVMYPKFHFSCLMSIITENEPITQDRIIELTGISRGYVSLILKQLQMIFPIKTIKRPGSRKKFFTYEGTPVSYLLDLLLSRIINPEFDYSRIEKIATDLVKLEKTESYAQQFSDFTQNILVHTQIQKEVREIAHTELSKAFEIGQLPKKLLSLKMPKKLVSFFSSLRVRETCHEKDLVTKQDPSKKYTQLKDEYFQTFRETLSPMYRADVKNWSIVLHEVLIEVGSTQDSIKKSTHLPQSTISELLEQLIQIGYIAKTKREGYRRVHYYPAASLTSLILQRFARVDKYVSSVLSLIDDTSKSIQSLENHDKQTFKFVVLEIKKGYKILQQYSNRMKYLSMQKIYEKHKEGFHFI